MEKAIPFFYTKGISSLTVPSQVLEKIKQQYNQSTSLNYENNNVVGLLFGNIRGKTIYVEDSIKVNLNNCGELSEVIKDFCKRANAQFIGFYSKGQFPDEDDINHLERIIRCSESSLLLLKLHQSNEDDLSDCFECVYDNIEFGLEKISILQSYSTPECSGPLKQPEALNEKTSGLTKIFYIGLPACLYDRSNRLEKLNLSDPQKLGMIDHRHPLFDNYHTILRQTAEADDLASKKENILHYLRENKEMDFDCVKYLRDLGKRCGIEVAYVFDVLLNCSDEIRSFKPSWPFHNRKRFGCRVRILNHYWGGGSVDDIKESYLKSTCYVLNSLMRRPKEFIDLPVD